MCFKGLVIRVITINLFSAKIWLEVYNGWGVLLAISLRFPILLASDNLITYFSNSMTQTQIKFPYMYHTLMLFVDVWMYVLVLHEWNPLAASTILRYVFILIQLIKLYRAVNETSLLCNSFHLLFIYYIVK